MRTILLTGGAGFIGSHVCDALLARGDKVVCVDNFNDYYDPAIKRKNISQHAENDSFYLCEVDITDLSALETVFEKHQIDTVCHLAARAGVRASLEDPLLYHKVNVIGTLNLLDVGKKKGVKHFVLASSSSVYGINKKVPFAETDSVDRPISPYAATKRYNELISHTYSHLHDLNMTCLRFFTVYGPRGRPDMAPYKFVDKVYKGEPIDMYGDGTSRRDYTYILDIVDGVLKALDKEFKYEIFNLGNSQTVELKEFISLVEKYVGKEAKINKMPMPPGDVPITYADLTKSKELLGYNPTTSFEDGLKMFVDWYLSTVAK